MDFLSMDKNDKILVLGPLGLVGSAIVRELQLQGFQNLLTPTRKELNLLNQSDTLNYFEQTKPKFVFFAAAKVGGILANNTFRADFIHQNLTIQCNVFEAAHRSMVEKLLFLGSSCIYPKNASQPLKESYLLTSELEPTNEPYAIAKIAGIKTIESFNRQYGTTWSAVMPTNLYGEFDNFDHRGSHVIPGLIARMHTAKINNEPSFTVWGSGNPRREFMYSEDMAQACLFIMNLDYHIPDIVNIGTGQDISINELANKIKSHLDYNGELLFDTSYPDGTMRKLLDVSRIHSLGWKHSIELDEGLKKSINFYLKNLPN